MPQSVSSSPEINLPSPQPSPAPASGEGEQTIAAPAIDAELNFRSEEEYTKFVGQFIACTLPKPRWTHRAHLVTGLWHLLHHTPEESLDLLRERIRAYNITVGGANTDTGGYHETLTQFYVTGINQWLAEHAALRTNPPELARRLLASRFTDKSFPLEFYSKELLFSVEARRNGVAPDLKPIDHFSIST